MPQCSAMNCKNRGVHTFPKDPKRRKCWESALRIENFQASKSARLCAAHFKEEDYFGQSNYTVYKPIAKFLKKTAVPSIFCFSKTEPINPASLPQQRTNKRKQKKLHSDSNHHEPEATVTHESFPFEVMFLSEEADNTVGDCTIEIKEELEEDSLPISLTKSTQVNIEFMFGSIYNHKRDDMSIEFYTGFKSYEKFQFVYSTLSCMVHKIKYDSKNEILSTEDQFFLTMMKLRQKKCDFELSQFFNIHQATVSNIFFTWMNFMNQLWSKIDIGLGKEVVQSYMPDHFKKYDKNLQVIDGTEMSVEKPTKCSGEDSVFADRNVTVKIPTFLQNKLPGHANKSVNIETIIGLTKTYKILSSELDQRYIPVASKIFFVCFMCCNFSECIRLNDE